MFQLFFMFFSCKISLGDLIFLHSQFFLVPPWLQIHVKDKLFAAGNYLWMLNRTVYWKIHINIFSSNNNKNNYEKLKIIKNMLEERKQFDYFSISITIQASSYYSYSTTTKSHSTSSHKNNLKFVCRTYPYQKGAFSWNCIVGHIISSFRKHFRRSSLLPLLLGNLCSYGCGC